MMLLLLVALLFLLCQEGRGHRLIPHVMAPETWRLGVLEKVAVQTSQQSESFPVTVSLVSYPDKKTTFSFAILALTPDNGFQGAVELSVTVEDSPGEFVYLVVESEVFREERRIACTAMDISAPRRRRRQSLLTMPQQQGMTQKFRNPIIRQCCINGSDYYTKHENCNSKENEVLKRSKPTCQRAYEECCIYTERHMFKEMPVAGLQRSDPLPYYHPYRFVNNVHDPVFSKNSKNMDNTILITVTQGSAGSAVTTTFTVKIDPTQDMSVELSSAKFHTNIHVSVQTLPPVYGDQ